jgi:hypothetical protein
MNVEDIVGSLLLLLDCFLERSWIERKAFVDRSRKCIQVEHDGGTTQPVDTSQRLQCLIDVEKKKSELKDLTGKTDEALVEDPSGAKSRLPYLIALPLAGVRKALELELL